MSGGGGEPCCVLGTFTAPFDPPAGLEPQVTQSAMTLEISFGSKLDHLFLPFVFSVFLIL